MNGILGMTSIIVLTCLSDQKYAVPEKSKSVSPIFFSFKHALVFLVWISLQQYFFKPLVILTKTGLVKSHEL